MCDPSSHSHSVFDINLSFPFLLGPQRGSRYYRCVFYQDAFSEKIGTSGKRWPLLEALLISLLSKEFSSAFKYAFVRLTPYLG